MTEKLYALYNEEEKKYFPREWPYENQPMINYKKEFFDDKIKDGWEVIEWVPRKPFKCILGQPASYHIIGNGAVSCESLELHGFTDPDQEEPSVVYEKFLCAELHSGILEYCRHNKIDEGYISEYVTINEYKDSLQQPCWKITVSTRSKDCDGVTEDENIYISKGGFGKDPEEAVLEHISQYGLDGDRDELKSTFIIGYHNSPMEHTARSHRDLEAEKAGY